MGKPQEAIKALKKALTIDPDFWVARRELGIVYWTQGAKDEAAQELEPLIKLHPDDGPVNVILRQYEFETQELFPQTLVFLSRVPGQVSADVPLSLIMAEAQLKTGETARAIEALKGLVGQAAKRKIRVFNWRGYWEERTFSRQRLMCSANCRLPIQTIFGATTVWHWATSVTGNMKSALQF